MAEPDIDLITARERLHEQYGRSPSYAQLWTAAAAGRIPAWRMGRNWRVREADLPQVAAYFRLSHTPHVA
jgi:hypothetical protein